MTEENQHLDENVEETTLEEERDSTEADEDFESLFAEDEKQEDAPVTREEYNRLLKGVKKLATERGREKSQPKEEAKKEETKVGSSNQTDDVSELFFTQIPKAELVSDDLKQIAESKYGGSILKAWRGESWLQEKATALENAKKEDEVNKSKISVPSSGYKGSAISFENIDLENKDHVKYLNSKPELRAKYSKWFTSRG